MRVDLPCVDQIEAVEICQDVGCLLQEMVKLGESQCGTLDEVWNSSVAVHCLW